MLFDFMTRSENQVVREMGRELRDGNISLQGLGEIEAYREAISSGFDRLGELGFNAMSEQLDEVIAQQEEAGASSEEAGDYYSLDEEDDLFQGLREERGGSW